ASCSMWSPTQVTNGCLRLPVPAFSLGAQLRTLKVQILNFDRQIMAWHRSNQASRRLDEIPGVGPALATAPVASVADPKAFRSGRNFSAWIGLVPKQHSSGGKGKLGSITTGRSLSAQPVHGRRAGRHPLCQDPWHQTSALAHHVVSLTAFEPKRSFGGFHSSCLSALVQTARRKRDIISHCMNDPQPGVTWQVPV